MSLRDFLRDECDNFNRNYDRWSEKASNMTDRELVDEFKKPSSSNWGQRAAVMREAKNRFGK